MNTSAEHILDFEVSGMHCAACARRIEKKVGAVEGVLQASVNLATERLQVRAPHALAPAIVAQAVEQAGFGASPVLAPTTEKVVLAIQGMHCAACARRIEKKAGALQGVSQAAVNLATQKATITYDPAAVGLRRIKESIRQAGFTVDETDPTSLPKNTRAATRRDAALKQRRQVHRAVAFWLPLFVLEMGGMAGIPWPAPLRFAAAPFSVGLLHCVLALPVLWIARDLLVDGWRALVRGGPNMFSLILLGSGAAFGFSLFGLLRVGLGQAASFDTYFPAASTIIALVLCGKYLESRAKARAGDAIESLLDLQPSMATLVENGIERPIDAAQIEPGDLLRVRPGERLPADGTVVEGEAAIDESLLTGESMPAQRRRDDAVVGGSLNRDGSLLVRATRIGRDTALAGIIRLVENAQQGQAPIARLADTVAAYFVPAVLGFALAAVAGWLLAGATVGFALTVLVSVLIIACPCSLGLATPAAIMVGTGVGARRGVLIKSPAALEAVHQLDTLVLDKTGTVTQGRPRVTHTVPFDGDRQRLLRLAAAVERGSEHPLAEAILEYAADLPDTPSATAFRARPGLGASAQVEGARITVGNTALAQETASLEPEQRARAAELESDGHTVVWILCDDRPLGLLALADTPRPDSAAALAHLHAQGIDTVLLTGDSPAVARAVARQVGIATVHAGVLPADKAAVIRRLQQEGHRVGMVGDGINDAPALAQADIGIALGAGTHAAADAADLVLLNDRLADIGVAIDLSRAVMRKIRQNLFWAFAYNGAGIPVAAGALHLFGGPLLDPMLASLAMALSSVSVVGNALRLRRYKPPA